MVDHDQFFYLGSLENHIGRSKQKNGIFFNHIFFYIIVNYNFASIIPNMSYTQPKGLRTQTKSAEKHFIPPLYFAGVLSKTLEKERKELDLFGKGTFFLGIRRLDGPERSKHNLIRFVADSAEIKLVSYFSDAKE